MAKTDNKDLGKLSDEELLLMSIEIEQEHCQRDIAYYIESYVHIYDPDQGGPIPFDLWPQQRLALIAITTHRLNILLKARQLGITWLTLAYATHGLLNNKGYSVVALSRRDEDAMELIHRMSIILDNMPEWMCIEAKKAPDGYCGLVWVATNHDIEIHKRDARGKLYDELFSRCTAFSASKDSGRSFTASLVIIDEWAFQQWAREIWAASYPTINRPTGGKVIGLSTALKGTLFQEICLKPAKFGFNLHFLPWWADPRRTQEWYEATKNALQDTYMQEYPSTPEEAFSSGKSTAFPEFSTDIHVCPTFRPPDHWPRWMGLDNGYDDPFAWGWYTVDEDGTVYKYREYTRIPEDPKVYYTDQANAAMELCRFSPDPNDDGYYRDDYFGGEYPAYESIDYVVAGLDAWHSSIRDLTGRCLADYYREGGFTYGLLRAVTDRRLRKLTLHEYLKPKELPPQLQIDGRRYTAKLQIMDCCVRTIESFPNLVKDPTDPEKVKDGDIDHWYDMAGYALIAHHQKRASGQQHLSEVGRARENAIREFNGQRRRKGR